MHKELLWMLLYHPIDSKTIWSHNYDVLADRRSRVKVLVVAFPPSSTTTSKAWTSPDTFLEAQGSSLYVPLLSYKIWNNLEPDLLSTRWSWIQSEGLGDCFSPFSAGQPTELELLQTHFSKLKGLHCMLFHHPRSSEIIWNDIHDCSLTERPWTKALGSRPPNFPRNAYWRLEKDQLSFDAQR